MDNHAFSLAHAQQAVSSSKQNVLTTQILAGDSLLLIDAAKRPLDEYVQPLCQLYKLDSSRQQHMILVLVATRKRLLQLRAQFEKQLDSRQDLICAAEESEAAAQLLSKRSCLLIATTAELSALMTQTPQLLTDAHLDCIVFDELDRLQAYGGSCFQALELALWQLCSKPQLVVTSRLWLAAEMQQLLQHAKQPLVLLQEALEAAVYGGLQLQVELGNSGAQQMQQLMDYLQQQPYKKQRTLIYCASETDFQELQQQLPKDDCILHRGRGDKPRLDRWQRQNTGQILLLRAHAPELLVDNVQSLIHFNMPSTWSQFRKRFAVLKTQIPNALLSTTNQQQLQSLILLNKQSQRMLPQLMEFMQQHGQPIDEKLAATHAQLQSLVARQCVICPVLLLHGHCLTPTCQYRHVLADVDRSCATVPTAGFIRFQLLKICTPSHFAARLVAHRATAQSSWHTLPVQQQYAELQQQLISYYAMPEHCVAPNPQELQQTCVRQIAANSYERVCVTFVPPADSATPQQYQNMTVRVKHLDLNTVICHAKVSVLLVCPLTWQQIDPLALDVRLIGLVPYNGEEIWQYSDIQPIAELLHPDGIYEANVVSTLAHTIFVDNIRGLQLEKVSYEEQLQCLGKFDSNAKQRLQQLVKTVAS
ncbi:putative ATP-dependent RNA helicase BoYb [Drosophila montana]|uniref:putative ATP-dependent RNA helicase BoYb n=1 Tax=Drosophila montana TaxID=40370 RepID=UPI00313E098F